MSRKELDKIRVKEMRLSAQPLYAPGFFNPADEGDVHDMAQLRAKGVAYHEGPRPSDDATFRRTVADAIAFGLAQPSRPLSPPPPTYVQELEAQVLELVDRDRRILAGMREYIQKSDYLTEELEKRDEELAAANAQVAKKEEELQRAFADIRGYRHVTNWEGVPGPVQLQEQLDLKDAEVRRAHALLQKYRERLNWDERELASPVPPSPAAKQVAKPVSSRKSSRKSPAPSKRARR